MSLPTRLTWLVAPWVIRAFSWLTKTELVAALHLQLWRLWREWVNDQLLLSPWEQLFDHQVLCLCCWGLRLGAPLSTASEHVLAGPKEDRHIQRIQSPLSSSYQSQFWSSTSIFFTNSRNIVEAGPLHGLANQETLCRWSQIGQIILVNSCKRTPKLSGVSRSSTSFS